jgi:hypothetical protein
MVKEFKKVRVAPDSELALMLRDATRSGTPVVIETGEVVYSVLVGEVTETPAKPTAEDVAKSLEGIREAAGHWKDIVDAEALKAYIAERRHTCNRPSIRL